MLRTTLLILLALTLLLPATTFAADKAIFDVRISKPQALLFALKVIEETAEGMTAEGMTPKFIVAFRGGTLPLLVSDPDTTPEDEKLLAEMRQHLAAMKAKGMLLQSCNVAARAFDIDHDELDPNLVPVRNSLISLIEHQNKGYALVPMY